MTPLRVGLERDEGCFSPRLCLVEENAQRQTGPGRAEPGPTGDAMDVKGQLAIGPGAKCFEVELDRIPDQPGQLHAPGAGIDEICRWDAFAHDGEALGLDLPRREGGGVSQRSERGESTGEGAVRILGDLRGQVVIDQVGDVDPGHQDRGPRIRSGIRDRDLQLVDVSPG